MRGDRSAAKSAAPSEERLYNISIATVIDKDHAFISGLLDQLKDKDLPDTQKQKRLFRTLRMALKCHTKVEEQTLYKFLKSDRDLTDEINESFVEHEVIDELLETINGTFNRETWKARMTVLQELIQYHVREEELDVFPKIANKYSAEDLDELAQTYLSRVKAYYRKSWSGGRSFPSETDAKEIALPSYTNELEAYRPAVIERAISNVRSVVRI